MMADIVPLNAWKGKLASSKQGFKKSITNLMLCLQGITELGNTIRWNELAQRAEWNGWPIEDTHLVDIRLILEANGFEPTTSDLLPAVMRHAKDNSFHPVRDYLRGLKWDGTPRVDRWMHDALGAPDSAFVRAAGRKTLIAAVARAFKPGCKVDTVLVLEGPQGIRKSTAIATLFGEDHTAESVNLFDQHNKMVMAMMGAWCVELAEFIAITKRDENQVKGMLSMRVDKVVLPYAKMASEHPRQCVFFGTINPGESGYLTDATGNRRYWPVSVTKANVEHLAEHRDQIWAEAYRLYQTGEPWWLTEAEEGLAAGEVADREEIDVWDEILAAKIAKEEDDTGCPIHSVSIGAALQKIGVPNDRMDRKARDRAANSLRRLGFVSKFAKERDASGRRSSVRIFYRGDPP